MAQLYQIRVTDRELAAVLAGLRLLQRALERPPLDEDIQAIWTDLGRLQGLAPEEIDALASRLSA